MLTQELIDYCESVDLYCPARSCLVLLVNGKFMTSLNSLRCSLIILLSLNKTPRIILEKERAQVWKCMTLNKWVCLIFFEEEQRSS